MRAAKGAKYAPNGTPLKFTLLTNNGNTRRAATGTIFEDSMKAIGVEVTFQTIDFNLLLEAQNNQTFDAVLLGWRNVYPDDPDLTQIFGTSGDILNGGSNNTSYSNPEFDDLQKAALTVTRCEPAQRADLYKQAQANPQ